MRKLFCLLLLYIAPFASVASEQQAWQAWREGQAVLIMRHALAPGTGDPASFQLQDCQTQRNLNAQGRAQARAWGVELQRLYSGQIQVYSSQWCRCLETAQLLALGEVKPLTALNSFFAGRGDRDTQTAELIAYFSESPLLAPTILVSHQVNITALTGIFPASGEAIIVALPLTQPANILAVILP